MRFKYFFIIIVLAAVLIYVYADSFNSPFQYDDVRTIALNQKITDFNPLKIFLDYPSRAFTQMTFSLNLAVGGIDTFGFHLVNFIIHLLNGILFFLLLKCMSGGDVKLSLFASALFLLYPVNVEAVTYISARSGLLSSFFLLAGMLSFINSQTSKRMVSKWSLLSLFLFFFASVSKESGFAFLFFLVLYFLSFERGNTEGLKKYLPFTFLWVVLVISYFIYNSGTVPGKRSHSLVTHLITHVDASEKYLRLFLFPVNLNIDHYFPLRPYPGIKTLCFLLLIIVAIYFLFWKGKSPAGKFFAGFYFVSFLPVALVPLNDIVSERWMYLASLSLSFFVAKCFLVSEKYAKGDGIRLFIAKALPLILIVLFALNTQNRNALWIDDVALWQDAAKKSPEKARPYLNLGSALLSKSAFSKAESALKTAVLIDNESAEPYLNLGLLKVMEGNMGEAFNFFRKAESINRESPYVRNNFGNFFRDTGNLERAENEYRKVISLMPAFAEAHGNLGIVLKRMGRYKEAEDEIRNASHMDKFRYKWRNELAILYLERGIMEKAGEIIENLISDFPNVASVRNTKGIFLAKSGKIAESEKEFSRAFTLSPSNINYLTNKALALKKAGRLDGALTCFDIAERHYPKAYDILFNKGVILFMKKKYDNSEKYFKKALMLNPSFALSWKYLGDIEFARGNRVQGLKFYSSYLKYGQKKY